jgi:REP element-mobilizing transposase RayT
MTICVANRRPVFGNPSLARDAVNLLKALSFECGVTLHAYCVMPDHIHVLLSPNADTGGIEFVRLLKGRLATTLRRLGVSGRVWQRSFHDRAIRQEENFREVIQYILHNPVRAGLVEDWQLYPFSGSLYLDR